MENNNIQISKVQSMLEWLKTKIFLDSLAIKAKNRSVKRGEVYECNFGVGIGSEMQKMRPCVIIQNDVRNIKSGNVIVAPISHTQKDVPCIAPIVSRFNEDGTVLVDGCANLSLIQTVSKARLGKYITKLSTEDMKNINLSICDSLGIITMILKLESKLAKKEDYIKELKETRNTLQDTLDSILKEANAEDISALKYKLKNIGQ